MVKTGQQTRCVVSGEEGFTLAEFSISIAIFSIVSAGLMMGFTSLERSYSATTAFTVNHADQMRISDSLAMDLRRALAVTAATNDTSIDIPSYYDAGNLPQTPTLDGKGGVYYGPLDGAGKPQTVRVHYYLLAGCIYRQQGAKSPVVLADNVQGFIFNVTDVGKVVNTSITFNPRFNSSGASAAATAGTTFYNTTLLRNTRTDKLTGVY